MIGLWIYGYYCIIKKSFFLKNKSYNNIKILETFILLWYTAIRTYVLKQNSCRKRKGCGKMDNATRIMINSLTQDILTLFNIHIPIQDIDELVGMLGGSIQTDSSCTDGSVVKEGDSFRILVSPFQDEKRRRFTIAHELGHLFLHMGYLTNAELWERQDENIYHRLGSSEKEYQANEFAAAFLMPQREYIKIMNENINGNKVNTSKIAEYFNVSVEAASNRGKFLGYLKW